MNMELLFDEFNIWTRKDVLGDAIFPRQLTLTRDVISNEYDFYSFFKINMGIDIYMSVFSLYQIRRRLFDTIFIDIDPVKDSSVRAMFNDGYNKFVEVVNILDDNDISFRSYFSGRGFHIYIDFGVVRLEHYRDVVNAFLKDIGLVKSYVDTHVIGDMMRMARFPLSKNSKTGLYMKRIDPSWNINYIWQYVKDELSYEDVPYKCNNTGLIKILMEFDNNIASKYMSNREYDYIENWDVSSMPMCIREGMMRLKYLGELDHTWRWILANFLLRAKGYEFTHNLFKLGKDFDANKTKYQLSYMMRKQYKQYGCDKIKDMGICPYKDDQHRCPFYPSMNLWLPSWDKVLGDVNEDK